jgi:hypothetical protein
MTDESKAPKNDDVPEGFTLVDTGAGAAAPSGGGSGVPSGFTDVTPTNPAGGGVLLNPGGDAPGSGIGTGAVPTPPEQKSVTNFLLNQAPASIIHAAQNIGHAAIHPIDTAWDMGKLLAGTLRAAGRGAGMEMDDNEADRTAQAFGHYIIDRYGSVDKAKNSLYHDPAGTLMDASAALSAGGGLLRGMGALSGIETASSLGRGLTTAGEVTNPLYVPGKVVSGVAGKLGPKAFDPKSATFAGEAPPFDPSTGTFDATAGGYQSPPQPKPKPPETTQDTVNRLRSQWGVKPPKSSGLEEPQAAAGPTPQPAQPAAPPAGSKLAENIRSALTSSTGVGFLTGEAINLLTHHVLGSVGGGLVAGAAIKYLPQLLKSEAGQRMLASIGPGSNAAAVASVASKLVPALNSLYQSQLQQQSMGQRSVFDRAKGGMVNPELARVQRERLRLPGIHGMLEGHK